MVSPQEPHKSDGVSSDALAGTLLGSSGKHSMARLDGA
jgi:hypothetical protein